MEQYTLMHTTPAFLISPHLGTGTAAFDAADMDSPDITVSGWAFSGLTFEVPPTIYIEVVDDKTGVMEYLEAKRYERPDVSAHFERPNLLLSGFRTTLRKRHDASPLTLRVLQADDRGFYRSEVTLHLSWIAQDLQCMRQVNTPPASINSISSLDGSRTYAGYPRWTNVIPLPPQSLMFSVGGSSLENFLLVGDIWAQTVSRHMPENATVLDIGCGCGRTARMLVNNRWITKYVGFDVIRENIDWCRQFVAPHYSPRPAEFHWFDLYSAEYNPSGTMKAQDLRFPCEDKRADSVFAASLFTHLLEPDAAHYLKEIGRVLSPRGTALLSIHNAVSVGTRFVGTEIRIDIEPAYFVKLAAEAGLREHERVDDLGGQQLFAFKRAD